jgi:hypothetical protein
MRKGRRYPHVRTDVEHMLTRTYSDTWLWLGTKQASPWLGREEQSDLIEIYQNSWMESFDVKFWGALEDLIMAAWLPVPPILEREDLIAPPAGTATWYSDPTWVYQRRVRLIRPEIVRDGAVATASYWTAPLDPPTPDWSIYKPVYDEVEEAVG